MEHWSILVEKEYLKFSCAHFLIFPDGSKERLHGHNYHVVFEVEGSLGEHGLVIDFKQVKPIARRICEYLDEHWIIPGFHRELTWVHGADGHTDVRYRHASYRAPTDEIIVLPINNASAENFAAWIGRTLVADLRATFSQVRMRRLRVEVSETPGQSGVYTCGDAVHA